MAELTFSGETIVLSQLSFGRGVGHVESGQVVEAVEKNDVE